jgi:antitoxin ParD1/3/4
MDTSRETMTISLPPSLKAKMDDIIAKGDYGTSSEYVRELIRQDIKRRLQDELENRLLESLDSGKPTPLTTKDFADIKSELRKRASAKSPKTTK